MIGVAVAALMAVGFLLLGVYGLVETVKHIRRRRYVTAFVLATLSIAVICLTGVGVAVAPA